LQAFQPDARPGPEDRTTVAPAFFLLLREGLEAALIVGIVGAYLVKIGRRDALRSVMLGVLAALVVSVGAGVVVVLTIGTLPLVVQETLEGIAALIAVGVLTWMLFWMRRQGRAMKGELEQGVDVALAAGSTTALVSLAFVAVVREGLETVLFLLALGAQTSDLVASTLIGAAAGLAVAVAIGYGIFAAGIRIDLRRFFTWTGVILIFVSAGLVAFAIHAFGEAGLIVNQGHVFDLSGVLPQNGPIGSVLAGLLGYRDAPTPLELFGYFAYLIPVLILFVWGGRRPAPVASGPTGASSGRAPA
jgi:high-affinity iron transporter